MTKTEKQEICDKIALKHGCEFQPTATKGKVALVVLPRYQTGRDSVITDQVIAELKAARVMPWVEIVRY